MTMEERGASRDAIWLATADYFRQHDPALIGVYRGIDGKWRLEVDDRRLSVRAGRGEGLTGGGPIFHPELALAYPNSDVLQTRVRYRNPLSPEVGEFSHPRTGSEPFPARLYVADRGAERRGTAVHELQHMAQWEEDFAPGGGLYQELSVPLMQAPEGPRPVLHLPFHPRDYYDRLAGEVEARNAERRLHLTANERREQPPWTTQDVAEENQIIDPDTIHERNRQLSVETAHSQRRDLDRLGFYSHALEAARALKQTKGTPEQMLAMLKKAGVKDAEIAATGLDRMLAARAASSKPALALPEQATTDSLSDLAKRAARMRPEDARAALQWLDAQQAREATEGEDIARLCLTRPAGFSIVG